MPHLDAKALETDPEGMALLRAAIAPQPKPATDAAGLQVRAIAEPRGSSAIQQQVRLRTERRQSRLTHRIAVA